MNLADLSLPDLPHKADKAMQLFIDTVLINGPTEKFKTQMAVTITTALAIKLWLHGVRYHSIPRQKAFRAINVWLQWEIDVKNTLLKE